MTEPKTYITEEQARQFLEEFSTMNEEQLFNILTEKLIEQGWTPPEDPEGQTKETV